MFDYHMHSLVSFDSDAQPEAMVRAAEQAGLCEICFTDHYDHNSDPSLHHDLFTIEDYSRAYDHLRSDKVRIRRGVEMGLTAWNMAEVDAFLASRRFDFVIGSIHYVDGTDPYFPDFWENMSADEAFEKYLLEALKCVKLHRNFDVLGHLNYVCKSPHNPTRRPLTYEMHPDLSDEIMRTLAQNGRGMEINTSGVDRVGECLPSLSYIKRFRELGGEIVTVGSDAHTPDRVGQHVKVALEIAKEVFGYVCTFEDRRVIYHKL